jgi:hypothetical protein
MNLKTINHFEKNRLDIFDLRRVIVHYEFGYLHILAAIKMSRLPKFTGIAAILQPSAARFMLYLQHIISIRKRSILSLEIETISGYKYMEEQQRNFGIEKRQK